MPAAMSEPIYTESGLGLHLRRLRKRAGLSGAELARRAGFSRQHVTNVEKGYSKIGADILLRWLAACGAPFRIEVLDEWGQVAAHVHSAATPEGADIEEMREWAELMEHYWRCDPRDRANIRRAVKTLAESMAGDVPPEGPGPH